MVRLTRRKQNIIVVRTYGICRSPLLTNLARSIRLAGERITSRGQKAEPCPFIASCSREVEAVGESHTDSGGGMLLLVLSLGNGIQKGELKGRGKGGEFLSLPGRDVSKADREGIIKISSHPNLPHPGKEHLKLLHLERGKVSVMLNLFQHLTDGQTLKRVQGDRERRCV